MLELIPILIGAIMVIIVAANVLIGVLAGFKKSIACLLAVIVSAVAAAGLTFLLCSPSLGIMPVIMDYVVEGVAQLNAQIGNIISVDFLFNILTGYFSMIIAPIVFMLSFIIFAIVLTIIFTVVSRFIPVLAAPPKAKKEKKCKAKKSKKGITNETLEASAPQANDAQADNKAKPQKEKKVAYCPKALHRLGGLGVGVVTGILVAIIATFPLVGLGDMACNAVVTVVDGIMTVMDIDSSVIDQYLPADVDLENPPKTMEVYEYTGSLYLFDLFASTEIDGDKVVLRQEVGVVLDIASGALDIAELGGKVGEEHVAILREMVNDLDNSPSLKYGLTATLSALIESGELDVEGMLGSNDILAPVVEEIVVIAASADKNTITGDLTTLVNVADILVKYDVLNESDYKKMLEKFGEGAVSELLVEVNKNERMRPVADEINLLSIRALAAAIGVPETTDERYELLMNELAYVIKVSYGKEDSERVAAIMPELKNVFEKYGMNVDGLALQHIAEGFVKDLGHLKNVDGPDVEEFFAVYAHAAKEDIGESAMVGPILGNLSAETVADGIVVNEDGTISINGKILNNYNANNYRGSAAYQMGHDHVDIGLAETLDSAEHMKSTLLTVEEVISSLGQYNDCEDVYAESEKVGKIFTAMIEIISDCDFDDLDAALFISEVGHVLDLMKDSEIFGEASAKNILTMVLQSDTMSNALGLSRKDMTNFANKINSFAEGKDTGYEEATKVIGNTVSAISKATDKNASSSEKAQATADMINSLSKENADMVTSMITGDMAGNFGSNVENPDELTDSLKDLINNMADYKDGNPDEASVNKEAEAVTKILSLAIAGSGDGAMFDKKDENGEVIEKGVVASDVDSFISTVVESSVVMSTVANSCEGKENGANPYGVAYDSEEEKADVAAALENYYVENRHEDADLESKLQNLAIVMDVEIDLNQYK